MDHPDLSSEGGSRSGGDSTSTVAATGHSAPLGGSLIARAAFRAEGAGFQSALKSVIMAENRHELVALVGKTLSVRWDNYRRFQADVIPTEPCMVVSFLGDTAAG